VVRPPYTSDSTRDDGGNVVTRPPHPEANTADGACPAHSIALTTLATPEMANFAGHLHGGAILRMLDHAAYVCASSYARSYVVTLSVDRVLFREIIHVGELVTLSATVNYTGRTSMEIGIRVDTRDIRTGATRHANSSYFTMVAVDDDGQPVQVPPLEPQSPLAIRRFDDARRRRHAQRNHFERQHMVPDDTESDIATRPHALTTATRAENIDA
jgi:acyl-CoA hydrolase